MKVVCDYCGRYISDINETCPHCGAINKSFQRSANDTPKTIEQLQKWYSDHNLPPKEVTRFFIGENYKEPKAFGIYQDGDRFIVYKNKADGSRAIRYDGSDEAYAVNELYLKLKEEIANQKAKNRHSDKSNKDINKINKIIGKIVLLSILINMVFILICTFAIHSLSSHNGYYRYNDNMYYRLGSNWYTYSDSGDWTYEDVDNELSNNYESYYVSDEYDSSFDTSDFKSSKAYSEWEDSQNDSDWDSGSSWDSSDSWDSGGTDWSSDW